MIRRLLTIDNTGTCPYTNLALEEYLLDTVADGTQILYLWQNSNTIVVGRNQDVFRECDMEQAEKDGVRIARRLSGGGAVFHDMGNLNFTFICRREDRDIAVNTGIILRALKELGVDAERSGRNDILVQGAKVSGNAFYENGDRCYHHGTLLIDVDRERMARYLSVSKEKLQLKGVSSVKSRVINLRDVNADISVTGMKASLTEAFAKAYGIRPETMTAADIPQQETERRAARFASREWIFGSRIFCNKSMRRRFAWGDIELLLRVEDGVVRDAHVFSDAMEQESILRLAEALKGRSCDAEGVRAALGEAFAADGALTREAAADRTEDIMKLVEEETKVQEATDGRQI